MSIAEPAAASALPTSRRGRWFVVGVLALALLLRVGVVFENRHEFEPVSDALDFDRIATSIANGDGFGDASVFPAQGASAMRAPLFPAALAAVYAVSGDHSWTAARVANALAGTLIVALVGLLAAQLFSRRVATVALLIAAVHPAMIVVGTSLQLEPILVALSLAAVAATVQHTRSPKGLQWPFVAGILMGMAILTREIGFALVLPMAWLLSNAWGARGRRRLTVDALKAPLTLVTAATLVVLPWTYRNAIELDEFIPVSDSTGIGLAGMFNNTARTNDEHPAQWMLPYEDPEMGELIVSLGRLPEPELDRALREASIDVIREHPSYLLTVAKYNVIRMFDLDGGDYSRLVASFGPYPKRVTDAAILASYPIVLLAIAGAFTAAARRAPRPVWAVPIIVLVGVILFLPASIRYRASLEPYFVLLAALAITPIAVRAGERLGFLEHDD